MVPRGTIGVGSPGYPILFLLVALTLVGIAVAVQGASSPPASGDWVVTSVETVHITNSTLDLRGDLDVMGGLYLDNSTIRVWSNATDPRILMVRPFATLSLKNTVVTAFNLSNPCLLWAEKGSALSVRGGNLRGLGCDFLQGLRSGGAYIATDVSFEGTVFEGCYAGLVINGTNVSIDGCVFRDCDIGACIANYGHLTVEGIEATGCEIGVMSEKSDLHVGNSTFTACTEGVIAYGGHTEVFSSTFDDLGSIGIGLYATKAKVVDNAFTDSDGMGLVAHTSEVTVEVCTFSNMTVDVRAMYSDIRVQDTVHDWTYDEALFMYRSDFNISGVHTNMSYWGLRTYAASGLCSNMTTAGAGFSVYVERSQDVTVEGLHATGYSVTPENRSQRAIFAVYSELYVSNASIEQVRSGLVFDCSRGLVEDVRILNCTHQGVVSMWSTWLVLRRVNVTNATAGFHTTLYNNLVFEDCLAESCRDIGYNLSAYDTSWLYRCKVVECPIGVWMYRSMTHLVNCSWDMISAKIGDPDPTYSVRSTLSYTYIEGGTVVGGDIGFGLTSSSTRIKNVTFRDVGLHCIDIIDSWRDVVEGCTFIGHPNGTAIVIIKASPTIRDNLVTGFKYGLAVYIGSDPLIEGNVVRNITMDGIQVFNRTRATLRGNLIVNCGEYGLHVAFFADAVSRDDVIEGSRRENIFVHTGASIDLQGAKVSGSRVGLHGVDSPKVRVAYCEFRDSNRGVLVSKVKDAPSMVEAIEVVVEGTYFVNHSGYCIGILDGDLEVIDCNLLDNGGGVVAWNSTVDLIDNSMVRCWLFALQTFDSSVMWTVQGRCRLYCSNLVGEVDLLVDGGVLEISDSKVEFSPGSSFRATAGSRLAFERVEWNAAGSVFTVVDSAVDLLDVAFDRVGPLDVSSTEDLGVSISGSTVSIVNSSFENALGGITLVDCMAGLYGTQMEMNALFGVLLRDSTVVMGWCEVKSVGLTHALVLEGSTLNAENVSVTSLGASVHATESSVELKDCSLVGGMVSPLELWDSSAVLVNSTHSPQTYSIHAGGQLEVWWYLSARVFWSNASELADIEVRIDDRLGQNVMTTHPTAEGLVREILVLALTGTETEATEHGAHTVSASIHAYTARVTVLLAGSTEVEVRMVDDDPPNIEVLLPSTPRYLSVNGTLEVTGVATDLGSGVDRVYLRLDYGRSILSTEDERFSFVLDLTDGAHIIDLTAMDHAGNTAVEVVEVLVETTEIGLWMTDPWDGLATNETTILVRGLVSRPNVTVTVNGLPVDRDGKSYTFAFNLSEGANRIDVDARDVYGHHSRVNATVMVDWTPPSLVVDTPSLVNTTEEWVLVTGHLEGGRGVTINRHPVVLTDGSFSVHFPVTVGDNLVTLESRDEVGNTVVYEIVVIRTEPAEEEEGSSMWMLPFILVVPILAFAEWYYFRGRFLWGDAR